MDKLPSGQPIIYIYMLISVSHQ